MSRIFVLVLMAAVILVFTRLNDSRIGRAWVAIREDELAAAATGSPFDYPLSSRLDENDAVFVMDNVFVPWERVFIYRNLELSRDQWWKTPSHLYGNHQAQVRYVTKLRFMIGIAQRMNEMTGNEANLAAFVPMDGSPAATVLDRSPRQLNGIPQGGRFFLGDVQLVE